MAERLCPFGDGRHKRRPWKSAETEGRIRSGLACVQCSKTWEWRVDTLQPTYAD
jgi:hypothetical protein